MSHKFSPGQDVVFFPGAYEVLNTAARCKITRLMPMEGAEYQYDIEVESGGLQRRARENQLRPLQIDGQSHPPNISDKRRIARHG
jgi:hypothetical protein